MAINVYWSCIENEWLRAEAPVPVARMFYKSDLFDKNESRMSMATCPAFNMHMDNLFALKSMYSYEFEVSKDGVKSSDYDQEFFNRHVEIKSLDKRLFSFKQSYTFFTDAPSLEVTLSEHPYLEDNEVTKRCLILPGTLDIGRWYRNTDNVFYLKKEYDSYKIAEGDVYAYIRFHTDEPINFIQFRQTDLMNNYLLDSIQSKNNKKRPYTVDKYYNMFRTQPLILKEIKANLLGE
jgi:hypothetical protein